MKPGYVNITVRMPKPTRDLARAAAFKDETSLNTFIVEAVELALKKKGEVVLK